MNENWFEIKVRYEKMMDSGAEKMVTESYLMDAYSFAEAEKRAVEELEPYIRGEFAVMAVSRKKFAEVLLNNTGDYFYEASLVFITLDEKSGSEKQSNSRMLVNAESIEKAVERINEIMGLSLLAFRLKSVRETPFVEVILYNKGEEERQ